MPTHRPLGLDLLEKIIRADSEGKLMETFLNFHRSYGWTFQNTLLGATSWGTVEPENLEAILSSNFKGMFGHSSVPSVSFLFYLFL
jgi:hypothetical protein